MLSDWPMQIRPKPVIGQHSDWYFQWTHGVDLPSIRLALVMPGGGLRTVAVTFYAPSFPQPCAWAHHSPDHTAAHSSSQLTAWSRPHSTQFLRTCNGRPPFHSRTYIEVVPIRYRPTFQTQNCQIWTEKTWGPMFFRLDWFFAHSPVVFWKPPAHTWVRLSCPLLCVLILRKWVKPFPFQPWQINPKQTGGNSPNDMMEYKSRMKNEPVTDCIRWAGSNL